MLNYVLLIFTALLAFFYLAKDWEAHKRSWRRVMVLALIILMAIGGIINTYYTRKENDEKRREDQKQIAGLQTGIQTANKNQEENTKQFLDSFGKLSQRVSDLQTQVKTAGLQKETDQLRAELESTRQALNPPKQRLDFAFVEPGVEPSTLRIVTLPVKDGIVHVEFTVLNNTEVAALNGEITLAIPDGCEFASEPAEFRKLTGQKNTERNMPFERLLPKTKLHTLSANIRVPEKIYRIDLGLSYRCVNCIVPKPNQWQGIIFLER